MFSPSIDKEDLVFAKNKISTSGDDNNNGFIMDSCLLEFSPSIVTLFPVNDNK